VHDGGLCAAKLSITTMASGRVRLSTGMSTCVMKARNTPVLVAPAMVMAVHTPSKIKAPMGGISRSRNVFRQ
jgi:hypothetical protein